VFHESDLLFSKTLNRKIINVNLKQRYYWLPVFFLRLYLIIGITLAMIYSLFWSGSQENQKAELLYPVVLPFLFFLLLNRY
jgi:hypothetical protein